MLECLILYILMPINNYVSSPRRHHRRRHCRHCRCCRRCCRRRRCPHGLGTGINIMY